MMSAAFFRQLAGARRSLGGALILALAGSVAPAQTAPMATGPYRIAGTVVNAVSGTPVRRATVAVLAESDSHTIASGETDAEGHFALERLPAAKYQLTASKRGFRTAFYDEHEDYNSAVVTGAGLDTSGLVFRLVPGAVLHGVVTGDGGDPVEGARVMLFERPRSPAAGSGKDERITQVDTATTDDTGAYEFEGLPAGDYLLAVTAEPWFALHHFAGDGRQPSNSDADANKNAELDVAYPVTFFDATTDEEAATRIPLKQGGRQEANISLHAVPALHLVVETPQKQDGSIARAELRQTIFGIETSAESAGFLDAMKSGTVEFSGVAPGRYQLLQGFPPRLAELNAAASGQVDPSAGNPVFNVSGLLRNGRSSSSTQGSGLPPDITVTLNPLEGTVGRSPVQGTVIRGAFSFPVVPAGNWEMGAESGGVQLPILSIASGGQTQAGNRLIVKDNPLSLLVTLSQGGTRVEGFVRRDGKGVAGAMVVLVPKDPALMPAFARRDQSDSDGSFSLREVAPGQYTVVAIEDGWTLEWARPGALAGYLASGIKVTVADQSGKTVQLPAAVPAQSRDRAFPGLH